MTAEELLQADSNYRKESDSRLTFIAPERARKKYRSSILLNGNGQAVMAVMPRRFKVICGRLQRI
jgi:hypothetical protein